MDNQINNNSENQQKQAEAYDNQQVYEAYNQIQQNVQNYGQQQSYGQSQSYGQPQNYGQQQNYGQSQGYGQP